MTQPSLQDLLNQSPDGQPLAGDIDEQMLLRMFLQQQAQQRQAMDPNILMKLCAMGLAGLVTIAAVLVAWMYRPVQEFAQADALRAMSHAVTQSSAHVQEAIATANPPEYNCVTLIGTCKFPEQVQRQPTVLAQQPIAPLVDAQAVALIEEWERSGYDEGMIQQFVRGLLISPDPGLPPAETMEIAYRQVFSQ